MIKEQILSLLHRISIQLDEVAQNQDQVKEEIRLLRTELAKYQEYTAKLEDRLGVPSYEGESLN